MMIGDDRCTFVAAALQAWAANFAERGRSVLVLLQQRMLLTEGSDFLFLCLGDKVLGNSEVLQVLRSETL